ncbi:MAG: metal ABC transporter permease [Ruminococcaceae bacterium]|nr:metal ABC transporter permease [Oscillospiraceae bacterium]
MIDFINAVFTNPLFMRGAVIGILVSLCAALLGVCLVLKRCSMIGDGLSHVAFGALSVAVALNTAPLAVAIPVVMIAAFFLLRISESSKINGDAAIAIISSTSLAIGVSCASFAGVTKSVDGYMFGSIWLVELEELYICVPLAVAVIATFIVCYHDIFLVTFDEDFARASGTNVGFYKTVISLLTALVVVIGMRIMGTLLISSLIIFPALSAMRVFKNFKSVVICSAVISVATFILGFALSYFASLPTGASIVIVDAIVFALFSAFGKIAVRR